MRRDEVLNRERIGGTSSMSRRHWTLRIEDMLECAEKIDRYTRGMDFATFVADRMTADAVARNLEIISEAIRHVPLEGQARYSEVSWDQIGEVRDLMVRDYREIEPEAVWQAVHVNLPATMLLLRVALERARTAGS
jgi:uncharacterized protein with HEPN domain